MATSTGQGLNSLLSFSETTMMIEPNLYIQVYGLGGLMLLSTIFQLYCGSQDLLMEETVLPGENPLLYIHGPQLVLYKVFIYVLIRNQFFNFLILHCLC